MSPESANLLYRREASEKDTGRLCHPCLSKMCYSGFQKSTGSLKDKFGDDVDNIIVVLEHNDHVCEMALIKCSKSGNVECVGGHAGAVSSADGTEAQTTRPAIR